MHNRVQWKSPSMQNSPFVLLMAKQKEKTVQILNTNHSLRQILYFLTRKIVSFHNFSYVVYLLLKNPPSISKKHVIERCSIK